MLNFCPHCGKSWSQTKYCAHCGENLSNLLEDSSSTDHVQSLPAELLPSFGELINEAEKTAEANSLEAFKVEKHSNGKYAILGLSRRSELSLIVPDCVEAIADGAFESCVALEITLPEDLKLIGNRAFANAKNLIKINLPKTLLSIGDEAFYGCEQLALSIPYNIRQGRDVLVNTKNHKVNPYEGLQVVDHVLVKCSTDKKMMIIPKGITKIGEQAFTDNRLGHFYGNNVENIECSEDVEYIGSSAFQNCSSLTSINVKSPRLVIEKFAFCGCSSLLVVDFAGCRDITIGQCVFLGCGNLKHIKLPLKYKDHLDYIGIDPTKTQVEYF